MLTYGEVYEKLEQARLHYEGLAKKAPANQKTRYLRLATIAKIFGRDLKRREGIVENGRISISLSLDEVVGEVRKKVSDVPAGTVDNDIAAIRARTIMGTGIQLSYELRKD